ncbi:MAG: type II toxin-antitoxin system RelE/ParE family toxin [Dissulfuribacterales bacterium]
MKDFPEMGRSVPEAEKIDVRELLFRNYRIIYYVEPERVLVLAVIHAARNISQKKQKTWEII